LSARSSARSAIDSAEGKIEDGREQLRQARKEFEEKRDEAFKKADLNGVITLEMLAKLLAAQNFEMPAGYVYDENDTQYLVRVGKKYEELEAMRNMLLFEMELDTVPEVRLGDVATVEITDNADSTYARIDDNAGVLLTIEKRSTASTSEVSDAIGAKFNSLMEKYPGLRLTPLFDQGIYIDLVVDSVFENLIYGGILAILVLLMFLWDFRPTFIVGISIPLSLVVAFVAMYFSNMTLNVMSLAGLALGVGMLVDNSIVIIENIYRLRSEGMPLFKACVVGAKQMSGAIFSSTLTTVCVFLPIVFVKGLARDLFTDMGLAITYSLLASLVVALTTVPALSSFMLRRTKEQKGRFFSAFQAGYVKLLDFTLRRKWVSILLSLGLLIWSALQIPGMGTSFLPEVDSNQMSVSMTLPATTTFNEMTSAADTALSRMLEIEEVDTIGVFTGGTMLASLSSATSGGKTVSFYLTLKEGKARRNAQIAEDIKERIQDLSVDLAFQTSSMDVTMLTGSGFSVAARGNDIDALRKTAKDVAALMQQVEGFEDISDGQEDVTPQITLIIDKEEAVKKKLTVAQIYMTVAASIADGTEISTMTVSGSSYPVIAVDSKSEKITPEELLNIKLEWENDDGDKEKFPLSDVATAEYSDSLDTIRRENQLRAVTASAEYRNGYNSGLVAREMQALLDTYTPPEGVTIVVSGENKMVNDVMQDLLLMIVIGIALIYFIMVAQFQSLLLPFIVLFTIPLAFTGGLVGLIWGGMDISVVSLIGFLVLAGVIVNNGIVFVDSVNQLRLEGKGKREALLETGRTRLRPILMTALTTILGMATMAMAQGMGAEMMQPMAVVVIGGLTYATFMTLFIVPALYDFFTGNRALRGAKSAESA
jgi:multidrug efflux pump subunit AcrB